MIGKYVLFASHVSRHRKTLPRKLTCPLKNSGWKTTFLLKWSLFRGHVSFWGYIKMISCRFSCLMPGAFYILQVGGLGVHTALSRPFFKHQDVDDDGSGTIGYEEFLKMMTHKILNRDPKDAAWTGLFNQRYLWRKSWQNTRRSWEAKSKRVSPCPSKHKQTILSRLQMTLIGCHDLRVFQVHLSRPPSPRPTGSSQNAKIVLLFVKLPRKKRFNQKVRSNQDICPDLVDIWWDLRKSSRPFAFLMMMQLGQEDCETKCFGFSPTGLGAFPPKKATLRGVDQRAVDEKENEKRNIWWLVMNGDCWW